MRLSVKGDKPPHSAHNDIAMGGFAGAIDPNFTESSMVIDYVRVFQEAQLSTDEPLAEQNISISPNPASQQLFIKGIPSVSNYEIYNSLGQLLNKGLTSENEINISRLNKGLYVLSLEAQDGQRQTFKFIKCKHTDIDY